MQTRIAHRIGGVVAALRTPHMQPRIVMSTTLLLLVFGLISVFSASSVESLNANGNTWFISLKQLIFASGGVIAMFAVVRVPLVVIRRLAPVLLIVALSLLVIVLIVGASVHGQRNWIPLGMFSLQPSEFAKLSIVLWIAQFVMIREQRATDIMELTKPLFYVLVPIVGLIVLEGDMGNVLVIGGVFAAMLFAIGFPPRYLSILTVAGVAAVGVMLTQGPAYRAERIRAWRDPMSDPEGYGWQFIHGTYALAVGGLFGQGPGASKEKWGALPEAHTDFILAVIGEEYGFIGTAVTLLLFALLIVTTLRVARLSTDTFSRLACAGMASWLFVQCLFNVGAVVGFLPIVGVTLPFVSYGGSSLLPMLVGMGVVVNCANAVAARPEPVETRQEVRR